MKGRALQKLCCVLRICEEDPSRIWQFIKRPATAQHLREKRKKITYLDLAIYKKAGDSSTFEKKRKKKKKKEQKKEKSIPK